MALRLPSWVRRRVVESPRPPEDLREILGLPPQEARRRAHIAHLNRVNDRPPHPRHRLEDYLLMFQTPNLPQGATSNLGPAAYIALRQYRGNDIPKWDELSDDQRATWCSLTEGAVESFMATLAEHKKNVDMSNTATPQHRDVQNF